MLYILLTLDTKMKDNVKKEFIFIGIMIHALITKKQQYEHFMIA